MKSEIILITPEMAKNWLLCVDANHKNRNIRKNVVSKYARDMKRGGWKLTHQGIAFDVNGHLRDGQHRLSAIVEAGVPVRMLVTFDLEECSYEQIDTNLARTFSDACALSDKRSEDALYGNTSVGGTVGALFRYGFDHHIRLSYNEKVIVIDAMKKELSCVYHAAITRRGGVATGSPIYAAAVAALLNGEAHEDIYGFFNAFKFADISTARGKNVQAALVWSNRVSSSRGKHISFDPMSLYLGTQNAIWNYCNNSVATSVAKIPTKERYPVKGIVSKIIGIDQLEK